PAVTADRAKLFLVPLHALRARGSARAAQCLLFDDGAWDHHAIDRDYLPQRNASGLTPAASSSSPARVAGCKASSGWRTASLLMTPPAIMIVLVARRPH